ncbi:MAG TPA: hypothetical protein VG013_12355 [Gemmataceae bacterium]|nr:hypothetical protein [Gemmataceae bacterium]
MQLDGLEQLLEEPGKAHFYDLLGGLADNLLTIGGFAGSFVACAACGQTFTLKGRSWVCESCGHDYELKFRPAPLSGTPFDTRVTVSGLVKPRCTPHWYFEGENWSVAEFLTQVLRLGPEKFLGPWLNHLGVPVEAPAYLETALCWPRFRFGNKPIQPDFALGFRQDLVLFEFKRPQGGTAPPKEVMGQLAFAVQAASTLNRKWHLVIVPGRDRVAARSPGAYVREAWAALGEAQAKWLIPEDALAPVKAMTLDELARGITILGWETLVRRTCQVIANIVPESWTRAQALAKLRYFQAARAELGLLNAVSEPL